MVQTVVEARVLVCNYPPPPRGTRKLQYLHVLIFWVAYTILKVVCEVGEAIIEEYFEETISYLATAEEWQYIAYHFQTRWNIHHAFEVLDGKHIAIRCPKN